MKLSKYIEGLQKTLKKHGDLEVVYAIDDEGNGYNSIQFDPTIGFFKDDSFYSVKNVEDYPEEENYEEFVGKKPTTVCVN